MPRGWVIGVVVATGCTFRHGTASPGGVTDARDQDAPIDIIPQDAPLRDAHVQNVTAIDSGHMLVQAFSQPVAAGDLLVGSFRGGGTVTVSDDVNGSWTEVPTTVGNMYVFYFENSAAATTLTITLESQNNEALRIVADEFSGVATSGSLDQDTSIQANSPAATWSAPPTSAIPAGELVYASVGNINNGVVLTAGSTDGVAMTEGGHVADGTNGVSFSEYRLDSAAGAQDASASIAPPMGAAGVQATFRVP